jgi:predicted Rossmann fold flavoprotein
MEDFPARYGPAANFVKPALHAFTNSDLTGFLESRGVKTMTREDGKVFPASMRSSDVLEALLSGCAGAGVTIRCDSRVAGAFRHESGFAVRAGAEELFAERLVIATGGCSYPATGSSGDGHLLAESLGHTVTGLFPALAPVIPSELFMRDLSGISVRNSRITVNRAGRKIAFGTGDVLFAGAGLSGPGILDISRYVRKDDELRVSLCGPDAGEAREWLGEALRAGGRTVLNILRTMGIPGRLAEIVLDRAGLTRRTRGPEVSRAKAAELAGLVTAFSFRVARTGGFHEAMATAGGVDRSGIDRHTMMSRLVDGLFFAGEVMDVDGDTGGYNIQWAFSSGMTAGGA